MTKKEERLKILKIAALILLTFFSFFLKYAQWKLYTVSCYILFNITIVLCLTINKNRIFDVFNIFLLSLALFHFGQVVLYVFNLPVNTDYGYDLFAMYSEAMMKKILIFSLNVFNLIACVGMLFRKTTNSKVQYDDICKKEVYGFGIFLFWILLFFVLFYDFQFIKLGMKIGYDAKFEYSNSLLVTADMYFPMSIICIIAGGNRNNKWKYYYGYALLRIVLQFFLVGNRGPLLLCLLIYEITRSEFQKSKKMRLGQILSMILLGVVLVMSISYVVVIRGEKDISFQTFLTSYNPLTLFLSEFGSTLITPILAEKYINTYGELGGLTYAGALTILLPFSTYYMGSIRKYKNVGAILNPYSPAKGALGGSLIGDIIINFGVSGIIIAVLIGLFLAYISNYIYDDRKNILTKCILIFFSYGIIWYARGASEELVFALKRCLYILVLWWLYKTVLNNQGMKFNKTQKNNEDNHE